MSFRKEGKQCLDKKIYVRKSESVTILAVHGSDCASFLCCLTNEWLTQHNYLKVFLGSKSRHSLTGSSA